MEQKARETVKRVKRVDHGGEMAFKPKNHHNTPGLAKNVSENGIYLLSTEKLLRGTAVLMYLPLKIQNKTTLCILSGKVVRVAKEQPPSPFCGYGIQFDHDLSQSSQKMLQSFVTEKLKTSA